MKRTLATLAALLMALPVMSAPVLSAEQSADSGDQQATVSREAPPRGTRGGGGGRPGGGRR